MKNIMEGGKIFINKTLKFPVLIPNSSQDHWVVLRVVVFTGVLCLKSAQVRWLTNIRHKLVLVPDSSQDHGVVYQVVVFKGVYCLGECLTLHLPCCHKC